MTIMLLAPSLTFRLVAGKKQTPEGETHLNNKGVKLYNILLPLWIIIFMPTYLWLVLIPLNYIVDRVVLRWSLRGLDDEGSLGGLADRGLFCRKHTWKICLAGFLSDFAGALLLLGISLPLAGKGDAAMKIGNAIMFDPFSSFPGFLIVGVSIALSAVCIYFLDKWILRKAGLKPEQVKRSAIRMALITAPYLYLFPMRLFYS